MKGNDLSGGSGHVALKCLVLVYHGWELAHREEVAVGR